MNAPYPNHKISPFEVLCWDLLGFYLSEVQCFICAKSLERTLQVGSGNNNTIQTAVRSMNAPYPNHKISHFEVMCWDLLGFYLSEVQCFICAKSLENCR